MGRAWQMTSVVVMKFWPVSPVTVWRQNRTDLRAEVLGCLPRRKRSGPVKAEVKY